MAQQNVYSLNVVGYVNLTLTNGFNLVANPLDAGASNTVQGILSTNLPASSTIFIFNPADGQFDTSLSFNKNKIWSGDAPWVPGQGIFIQIAPAAVTPVTITAVGQITAGSYTNHQVSTTGGFSLVGSTIPVSGPLDGTGTNAVNFTPIKGDTVFLFDNPINNYDSFTFTKQLIWSPSDPNISVGQGFFLFTTQTNWVQSFSVQ